MAAEHTMHLFTYGQSSDQIVDDIIKKRRDWGRTLPSYDLDVWLPRLQHSDGSHLPCRETAEDVEVFTSDFSTQIRNLFDALVACEDLDSKAIDEDSWNSRRNHLSLTVKIKLHKLNLEPSCHHRTYHANRIFLHNVDSLPSLSYVTTLRLIPSNGKSLDGLDNVRPISPSVPIDLLTHLPALKDLECPWLWEHMPVAFPSQPMRHYTRPWEGPWRDARHEFGRAALELDTKIRASLRKARLWFWKPGSLPEGDQGMQMPNLVHPADVDPVSLGLRAFASHLEELDVRGFLMPEIFDVERASWPRMKHLRIEFHPWRPDGSWYFVGPHGEDPNPEGFLIHKEQHYPPVIATEEDERVDDKYKDYEEEWYDEDERRPDMFRTEPLPDRIEPLLASFAETLRATSTLEDAELFTWLGWYPSEERQSNYEDAAPYEEGFHKWGVKYTAAKKESKALIEFEVGDWRPSADIIRMFETLGGDSGSEITWKAFEFVEDRPQDHHSAFI